MSVFLFGGLLGTVFVLSWTMTAMVRHYALRRMLIDIPNQRSSHSQPTPRGGGLAIVVLWTTALILCWLAGTIPGRLAGALACAAFIATVGWWDDVKSLPPTHRLIAQLIVAASAITLLGAVPGLAWDNNTIQVSWLAAVVAVLGITWLTNLYNFMDGIDGLAGAQAVIAALALAGLFWMKGEPGLGAICGLLAAAAGGFLVLNWPPARIFMGDVGSVFLGFVFGVIVVAGHVLYQQPVALALLPLAVFILDSTYTLFMRALRREDLTQAHRSHIYQQLVQRGWSHRRVTLYAVAVSSLTSLVALITAERSWSVTFVSVGTFLFVGLAGAGALKFGSTRAKRVAHSNPT